MKTTLVIMAAGLGSRYGGNKQTDGVGPNGEILMEYGVYDAVRAGFDKIVFIIKPDMLALMKRLCGDMASRLRTADGRPVEVCYAYQDTDTLPTFYTWPEGRTKPLGTAHAVLCTRQLIHEPFCVINADDYYGADAYRTIYKALQTLPERGAATMVGYLLRNTVTAYGTVSRGVCHVKNGCLSDIRETLKIALLPDGTIRDEASGVTLEGDAVVSMNFWGFMPSIFPALRNYFEDFLRNEAWDNIKAECLLPTMMGDLTNSGKINISVLNTNDRWFGLTYKEDVDDVRESPTLQMLESMEEHLCGGAVKVYDPWVERDEVPGQVHSMEEFLDGLEMVIVMVGHSQIKGKPEAFGGRILIDPRNVCGDGENVYKL